MQINHDRVLGLPKKDLIFFFYLLILERGEKEKHKFVPLIDKFIS